jgi:hypothetical protein
MAKNNITQEKYGIHESGIINTPINATKRRVRSTNIANIK